MCPSHTASTGSTPHRRTPVSRKPTKKAERPFPRSRVLGYGSGGVSFLITLPASVVLPVPQVTTTAPSISALLALAAAPTLLSRDNMWDHVSRDVA